MTEFVQLNVPGISPELNAKVRERMDAEGLHRNDVVVPILCKRFRVKYNPNRRRAKRMDDSPPEWHLSVPKRLRTKLNTERAKTETSVRDIVVQLLSDEFGVEFVPVFHTERRRKSWNQERAA